MLKRKRTTYDKQLLECFRPQTLRLFVCQVPRFRQCLKGDASNHRITNKRALVGETHSQIDVVRATAKASLSLLFYFPLKNHRFNDDGDGGGGDGAAGFADHSSAHLKHRARTTQGSTDRLGGLLLVIRSRTSQCKQRCQICDRDCWFSCALAMF